jgi:hypothetical protein
MMPRTVPLRLMNLAGTGDALAELEVGFLDQLLPLFQVSDGTPRADVEVVRVSSVPRFLDYLFVGDVDLIHLASHGTRRSVQIGSGNLSLRDFKRATNDRDPIGAVVINTSCQMASEAWVEAFLEAGALAYIAAKKSLWAKDAAIFAAAFYSAYFGTIHVKKSALQRAFDSYRLAHAAYVSFVPNASRSRFYFDSSDKPSGKRILSQIKLQ